MSPAERRTQTAFLFEDIAACVEDGRREGLEQRVILINVGVARSVARRYRNRGLALDDLEQTAFVALIRAVQKFDPERGYDFMSYAVPTIDGELKRHFRDQGWTIRVPRRIQEIQKEIERDQRTSVESVDATALAARLGLPRAQVVEALQAQGCFTPTSLDLPIGEPGGATLGDVLPSPDTSQVVAEARLMLVPLVRTLSIRDRRILALRYVEDLSQAEIGRDVGLSQMQVSRVLGRLHRELREGLTGEDGDVADLDLE